MLVVLVDFWIPYLRGRTQDCKSTIQDDIGFGGIYEYHSTIVMVPRDVTIVKKRFHSFFITTSYRV